MDFENIFHLIILVIKMKKKNIYIYIYIIYKEVFVNLFNMILNDPLKNIYKATTN